MSRCNQISTESLDGSHVEEYFKRFETGLGGQEMGKAMKALKRCLHWYRVVPTLQAEEERALPIEKVPALD